MSVWKETLDNWAAGNMDTAHMPPHYHLLSLPDLSAWDAASVTFDWQASEKFYQGQGSVFGGYISALADYVAGTALLTVIGKNEIFVTKKLEVEFKKPITAGPIKIVGEVIKREDRYIDVEVRFIDADDSICAVSHAIQKMIKTIND